MSPIFHALRRPLLTVMLAAGTFGLTAGCAHHHHHHDDACVVIHDDHGWRHEGYYDRDRHWRGGYYDERRVYHNDPYDWRH